MKKGYSKPLTEIELNVILALPVMGSGGSQGLDDFFDPAGLSNANLVGNSPRMGLQNKASNLWDDSEN